MNSTPAQSLFRQPNFLLFWFSRVFTLCGNQMQSVALAWQIYDLTHSALDLGLVGLMHFLPRIALVFVAGSAADRHNRRTLILLSQLVQAAALAGLTLAFLAGALTREGIFVVMIVTGAARAFEMPSTQALLPSLVPAGDLSRAVALSASAMQTATLLAPALGGVIYAIGPVTVYGLATVLFAVAAGLMAAVAAPPPREPAQNEPGSAAMLAGIRFIRAHPAILGAISLDLFAVLLGGATALLPIVARDILHTGPWGLGLLRSAPAAGAIVMSLILARYPLKHAVGRIMFGGVAAFGLATIAFGLSRNLWFSLAALLVLGASDMISVVIRSAFVQLQTPDDMRGRVSAVNSVFIGASNQLGEFESGLTAAWWGTVPAIVLGGLGTVLVVLLWMRLFPQLKQANSLSPPSVAP